MWPLVPSKVTGIVALLDDVAIAVTSAGSIVILTNFKHYATNYLYILAQYVFRTLYKPEAGLA